MSRRAPFVLLACVILLTVLGFIMQLSTAGFSAETRHDTWSALRRQGIWCALGLVGGTTLMLLDYRRWKTHARTILAVSVVLLALCFIPGIGKNINGATRWIGLGPLVFQPSEPARLGVLIALAAWCATFSHRRTEFLHGFLFPLLILALPVGLIALEVDLGAAALLFTTGTAILFLAGTRLIYVASMALLGAALLFSAVNLIPNRAARFTAFTLLWQDSVPKNVPSEILSLNHQQEQGLIALGAGGPRGMGLGDGRQKRFYLPYCHTDFIFPVVGEELGLPGTLGTAALFTALALAGLSVAARAPDRFGALLGSGIVLLITIQAIINIGVTTACMPNKGMPLPFLSYGGSNLCSCLCAVGLLLGIFRQSRPEAAEPEPAWGRPKLTVAI